MPKTTDRNLLIIGEEEILFDPSKILLSECVAAERATGLSWPQIISGLNNGLALAIQAVVWIMRKRSNPKLNLRDVEFNFGDYVLLDPDEHPDYLIPTDEELAAQAALPQAAEPEDDTDITRDESEGPKAGARTPADTDSER